MVDLGQVLIKLAADTSHLDRQLNQLDSKLKQYSQRSFRITPVVDHKPLDELNRHFDLKIKHHRQIQNYFDSKPLRVNIDLSSIDTAKRKISALQQMSAANIRISGQQKKDKNNVIKVKVDIPDSISNTINSLGQAVIKRINHLISTVDSFKNLNITEQKKSQNTISANLEEQTQVNQKIAKNTASNFLGKALGSVGLGLTQGATFTTGQRFGNNFFAEIETKLLRNIGDVELISSKLGAVIAQKIDTSFDELQPDFNEKKLGNILKEFFENTLGANNIRDARSRVLSRNEQRQKELTKETETGYLPSLRAEAKQIDKSQQIIFYSQQAIKALELRQEEIRNNIAGRLNNLVGELDKINQELEENGFENITPQQRSKISQISKQIEYLQQPIKELDERKKPFEEKIASSEEKISNAQTGIGYVKSQAKGKTLEGLPPIIQRILGGLREELPSDLSVLPNVKTADARLKKHGAEAAYDPIRNEVLINSALQQRIKSNTLTQQDIFTLIEEFQHAQDAGFGADPQKLAKFLMDKVELSSSDLEANKDVVAEDILRYDKSFAKEAAAKAQAQKSGKEVYEQIKADQLRPAFEKQFERRQDPSSLFATLKKIQTAAQQRGLDINKQVEQLIDILSNYNNSQKDLVIKRANINNLSKGELQSSINQLVDDREKIASVSQSLEDLIDYVIEGGDIPEVGIKPSSDNRSQDIEKIKGAVNGKQGNFFAQTAKNINALESDFANNISAEIEKSPDVIDKIDQNLLKESSSSIESKRDAIGEKMKQAYSQYKNIDYSSMSEISQLKKLLIEIERESKEFEQLVKIEQGKIQSHLEGLSLEQPTPIDIPLEIKNPEPVAIEVIQDDSQTEVSKAPLSEKKKPAESTTDKASSQTAKVAVEKKLAVEKKPPVSVAEMGENLNSVNQRIDDVDRNIEQFKQIYQKFKQALADKNESQARAIASTVEKAKDNLETEIRDILSTIKEQKLIVPKSTKDRMAQRLSLLSRYGNLINQARAKNSDMSFSLENQPKELDISTEEIDNQQLRQLKEQFQTSNITIPEQISRANDDEIAASLSSNFQRLINKVKQQAKKNIEDILSPEELQSLKEQYENQGIDLEEVIEKELEELKQLSDLEFEIEADAYFNNIAVDDIETNSITQSINELISKIIQKIRGEAGEIEGFDVTSDTTADQAIEAYERSIERDERTAYNTNSFNALIVALKQLTAKLKVQEIDDTQLKKLIDQGKSIEEIIAELIPDATADDAKFLHRRIRETAPEEAEDILFDAEAYTSELQNRLEEIEENISRAETESINRIDGDRGRTADNIRDLVDDLHEVREVGAQAFEQVMGSLGGLARRVRKFFPSLQSLIKLFVGFRILQSVFSQVSQLLGETLSKIFDFRQNFESALEFKSLQNLFNNFSSGANRNFDDLIDRSNRLSVRFQDLANTEISFGLSLKGSAIESQSSNIIGDLVQGVKAFEPSSEQFDRAITSLQQVAGKGVVSMEELRGQLSEAIPGAMAIAARSLNMGQSEFNQLVATGELLATDFLPRFSKQLKAETFRSFVVSADSTRNKLAELQNEIGLTSAAVGDFSTVLAKPIFTALSGGLKGFRNNLDILKPILVAIAGTYLISLGNVALFAAKKMGLVAQKTKLAGLALKGLKATIKFLVKDFLLLATVTTAIKVGNDIFTLLSGRGGNKFIEDIKESRKQTQALISEISSGIDRLNQLRASKGQENLAGTESSLNKQNSRFGNRIENQDGTAIASNRIFRWLDSVINRANRGNSNRRNGNTSSYGEIEESKTVEAASKFIGDQIAAINAIMPTQQQSLQLIPEIQELQNRRRELEVDLKIAKVDGDQKLIDQLKESLAQVNQELDLNMEGLIRLGGEEQLNQAKTELETKRAELLRLVEEQNMTSLLPAIKNIDRAIAGINNRVLTLRDYSEQVKENFNSIAGDIFELDRASANIQIAIERQELASSATLQKSSGSLSEDVFSLRESENARDNTNAKIEAASTNLADRLALINASGDQDSIRLIEKLSESKIADMTAADAEFVKKQLELSGQEEDGATQAILEQIQQIDSIKTEEARLLNELASQERQIRQQKTNLEQQRLIGQSRLIEADRFSSLTGIDISSNLKTLEVNAKILSGEFALSTQGLFNTLISAQAINDRIGANNSAISSLKGKIEGLNSNVLGTFKKFLGLNEKADLVAYLSSSSAEEIEARLDGLQEAQRAALENSGALQALAEDSKNFATLQAETRSAQVELSNSKVSLLQAIRQFKNQAISLNESIIDYQISASREARNLGEQWESLNRSLKVKLLETEAAIADAESQINSLQLKDRLTLGIRTSEISQLGGAITEAFEAQRRLAEFGRKNAVEVAKERLATEEEIFGTSKQIRDLVEQQNDMERSRLKQLRDLALQQEEFVGKQKEGWQALLNSYQDINKQAGELGIAVDQLGGEFARQGNSLVEALNEITQKLTQTSSSIPMFSSSSSSGDHETGTVTPYEIWSSTDGGRVAAFTGNNLLSHHDYQKDSWGYHVWDLILKQNGKANVPVPAAASGKVTSAGYNDTAGNYVQIEHTDGQKSKYLHLDKIMVKVGDQIKIGQAIGIQGNTGRSSGTHLHFGSTDPNLGLKYARGLESGTLSGAQVANTPTAQTYNNTGPINITALRRSIIGKESTGNFKAVNMDAGGHYGYGQLSGANVKTWSREVFGRSLSIDEFLNSPEKQIKIIEHKLAQYVNNQSKAGRSADEIVRRVGSLWYSGNAENFNNTKPEYASGRRYPSIYEYGTDLLNRYNKELGNPSTETTNTPMAETTTVASQVKVPELTPITVAVDNNQISQFDAQLGTTTPTIDTHDHQHEAAELNAEMVAAKSELARQQELLRLQQIVSEVRGAMAGLDQAIYSIDQNLKNNGRTLRQTALEYRELTVGADGFISSHERAMIEAAKASNQVTQQIEKLEDDADAKQTALFDALKLQQQTAVELENLKTLGGPQLRGDESPEVEAALTDAYYTNLGLLEQQLQVYSQQVEQIEAQRDIAVGLLETNRPLLEQQRQINQAKIVEKQLTDALLARKQEQIELQSAIVSLELNSFRKSEQEAQIRLLQQEIEHRKRLQQIEDNQSNYDTVQQYEQAKRAAEELNQVKLDQIRRETDFVTASLLQITTSPLKTFFAEFSTEGVNALRSFAVSALTTIRDIAAEIAAAEAIKWFFGAVGLKGFEKRAEGRGQRSEGIGGLLGSVAGSVLNFNHGGEIPNFNSRNFPPLHGFPTFSSPTRAGKFREAEKAGYSGGDVLSLGLGVAAAMQREGQKAVPIVAHAGEVVLSDLTGDVQLYKSLKEAGAWDAWKRAGVQPFNQVKNYQFGGEVGQSSTTTKPRLTRGASGNVTIQNNWNIQTSDADSFQKSQEQIEYDNRRNSRRSAQKYKI